MSVTDAVYAERPSAMRPKVMPATCGRSGASASNLRSTRSGLPPVPFAGLVATERLSTPDAPHAEPAHDVHHLVAARFPGIPALADEPMPHLAASVHGGGPAGMDVHDVAVRRLVARPHAADGPWPGHAVAARRGGTAVRRFGQDLADRPGLETVPVFVDARGHQRRVGSSPAAEKAEAVVDISFARRNSVFSARGRFNSAIASCADRFVSAAAVASDRPCRRRSDSDAIPGSLATCSIAFVSDEYDDLDSVSNLTAFARNSGVYRAPFAMVPSSSIELEEKRNKKQAISVAPQLLDCGVFLRVGVHSTSW